MSKSNSSNTELGKLLAGRSDKPRKGQHSFYLTHEVYDDFVDTCIDIEIPASQVIEAFMKDFVASKSKARSK